MKKGLNYITISALIALCLTSGALTVHADTFDGACAPDKDTASIGESVTFAATATGGTGSYSYWWNGSGVSYFDSYTSPSFTRAFYTPGLQSFNVRIKSGNTTIVRSCDVTILDNNTNTGNNSNLGGSCTVTPSNPETGDSVVWQANPTGGNGSYTYTWSGTNNLSGNSRSLQTSYGTNGLKNATVDITSNGVTISRSCSTNVGGNSNTNNDNLDVSCSANPRNADVDERVTWSASVSGGTGGYDYSWDGDDNLSGSSRTVTHRYDTRGTYDAEITVTDNSGDSMTRVCSVNVSNTNNNNDDVAVYYDSSNNTTSYNGSGGSGSGTYFDSAYSNTGATNGNVFTTYNGATTNSAASFNGNTTGVANTNNASGVYLSQVPYTGSEDGKITFYIISFLTWSIMITYYILRPKRRMSLETTTTHKPEIHSNEILKKYWDR